MELNKGMEYEDLLMRNQQYAAEIEMLREEQETYFKACDELLAQTIELRSERDEARREVCQFRSTSYPHDMKEVYEIADSRGWDCFKENK